MDAQPIEGVRASCPFADSRPEGCICIALREPKRVSIDYQARFCLTDRHVHCRRFQRAVPEVPVEEAGSGVSWGFEARTFLIAGLVAAIVLIAAAAFTFQGTWAGWFNDHSTKIETGLPDLGSSVTPTPIILGGGSVSATSVTTTPEPTTIPILSSSPTAVVVSAATETATPTPVSTPTVTPTPSPTPATATPTPVPSPTPAPVTPTPEPSPTPQIAQAPTTHVVAAGETLSSIGTTYNVPPHLIALANNLSDADVIATGTTLFIPDANGRLPDGAPVLGIHVVQAGESLSSIASSFGVTTQNLMYANGISDPNYIQVGQVLTIPRGDVAPPAPSVPAPAPQTTYTVQAHDTLYSIAKSYGVTIEAIMAANGLTDRTYITTGQVLVIPNQ